MTDLPTGYARISPYLLYADVNRAVEWLAAAFGTPDDADSHSGVDAL